MNIKSALGGAIFATLLPKSQTHADSFAAQDGNSGWLADGSSHTYCWGSGLQSSRRDNVDLAMKYMRDYTDVHTYRSYCSSSIDVDFQESNLPAGVRGRSQCVTPGSGTNVCNSHRVWLDIPELQTSSPFENNLNKTIRHELGHTVGLAHGSSSGDCMQSGAVNGDLVWITFSQHHKDHINAQY